jgi:hypothetical protein
VGNENISVEYVKWGLANRFDDTIELNESLIKNKELHDAILSHERGHHHNNTFKQDFIHDLRPINKLSQKDLIVFMIKHPRTFTQILPFYWSPRRKKIIYDINTIVIYIIVFAIISSALFIII